MATNPFAEFAAPAENPFAAFAAPPQAAPPYFEISGVGSTGVPGPRRAPGLATQFGRTAASLADVTLGGILPGAAQYLAYPLARLQRSPEEAQAITQNLVGAIDRPFGKAFGVTETPEYQQEAGRQLMDFIGQNFQKGAKFIAEKTGIPAADVESYMATLSLTAPKVVPPVAKAVTEAVAPVVQDIRAGVQLPFEPMLQKGRERRSAESYARAPELDAIAEAQRLKLVIDPRKIDPSSVMARGYSLAAGPRGPEAMVTANKPRVTQIAKDELGLDATTSLTSTAPFKQARANVAAPYDEVAKLPTMVADETIIASLNDLRRNDKLIGGKGVSEKVNKLIDDAVDKTQAGLTGAELLENVRTLRADATKIYKNQSATPKQIAVADANLAIATQLESMIDSNIFNPRLLDEWRGARQDMARTYAYEGATDFNTGTVDVAKLARITSKDNALTGDIASLGKIAGNFPEAFAPSAESKFFSVPRLTRAGISGTAGALIGGAAFDTPGYILGTAAGSLLGEISGKLAANRLASPSYQAGLQLQDFRIPVNQLAAAAAPIPQNQAIVPFDPRNAIVPPGEGTYFPNFAMQGEGQGPSRVVYDPVAKTFRGEFGEPPPSPVTSAAPPTRNMLPAPSAESTLNMLETERARAGQMSRTLGQQAEQRGDVTYYRTKSGQTTTTPPNEPADMYTRVFRGTGGPEGRDIFELQPKGSYTPPKRGEGVAYTLDERGNLVPDIKAPAAQQLPVMSSLESAVQKLSGQVIEQPSTTYKTMTVSPKTGAQPYTRIIKQEGETTFERGVPRAFDLTATEKIAWNKAKANLAEVMPGMKALSDEAIAARMANVKWAEQAVANARAKVEVLAKQEAAIVEQLANRNNLRMMAREIEAKNKELAKIQADRQSMMDLAEQMEEGLRTSRPDVSGKQQGPKTRAAKRNALAPDNQNNLAE